MVHLADCDEASSFSPLFVYEYGSLSCVYMLSLGLFVGPTSARVRSRGARAVEEQFDEPFAPVRQTIRSIHPVWLAALQIVNCCEGRNVPRPELIKGA